ncbi:unnamed protein product, partial [Iphiclides podalirius]
MWPHTNFIVIDAHYIKEFPKMMETRTGFRNPSRRTGKRVQVETRHGTEARESDDPQTAHGLRSRLNALDPYR